MSKDIIEELKIKIEDVRNAIRYHNKESRKFIEYGRFEGAKWHDGCHSMLHDFKRFLQEILEDPTKVEQEKT